MSKNEPSVKVGDIFKTNTGDCTIVRYNNAMDVIVEFSGEHKYRCKVDVGQLKRGNVKNYYYPDVAGVGYIGEGNYNTSSKIYRKWVNTLHDCVADGTKVKEEWLNFQNFAMWWDSMNPQKGWWFCKHLVDIPEGGVLDESNCFIIPNIIHRATTKNFADLDRGLPTGVYVNPSSERYYARVKVRGKNLTIGSYDSEWEAFNAYVETKEGYIKELAQEYKNVLPKQVFEILMNWRVSR